MIKLCCNGIVIPSGYFLNDTFIEKGPFVSVHDFDGRLPLTLDRKKLVSNHLPFEGDLVEDICKDIIACLLVSRPCLRASDGSIGIYQMNLQHRAFQGGYTSPFLNNNFVFFENGFSLFTPYFIRQLNLRNITLVSIKKDCPMIFTSKTKIEPFAVSKFSINSNSDIIRAIEQTDIFRDVGRHFLGVGPIVSSEAAEIVEAPHLIKMEKSNDLCNSRRIFLHSHKFNSLFSKTNNTKIKELRETLHSIIEHKDVTEFSVGETVQSEFSDDLIEHNSMNIEQLVNYKLESIGSEKIDKSHVMSSLLKRYFEQNCIIPYSLNERKKVFPKAFQELKPYILNYF